MSSNSKYSLNNIAEQIVNYNNTVVELLSKINQQTTTDEPTLSVKVMDSTGNTSVLNVPSFNYLKSEIDRLNNNLNSIYNIDGDSGALIGISNNKYKRVISVDLNKEPNDISNIPIVNNFYISKNWFFDSMINPQLFVNIDLSDKISNTIRKCLVRRYIIEFEYNNDGYTTNGIRAMDSFNALFRGKNDIKYETLQDWIRTTQGVLNREDVNYDESNFDLEPSMLRYSGLYSVLRIEEDTLNKKLWYHLDTLNYFDNQTSSTKTLAIGDTLIINSDNSSTKYIIQEISLSSVNPKVTLLRIEGNDIIPTGVETLKIYSEVVFNKNLRVSIGYDEFNIIFIKPINADNNIIAKNWSGGVGYYSNDLRLTSSDSHNGMTLSNYYSTMVDDYGLVLKDLVAKKIPNVYGSIPNAPQLSNSSFKVVQINEHLNNIADADTIKSKNSERISLKSKLDQLNSSIESKNKEMRVSRFNSDSAKNAFNNELSRLYSEKESNTKLLSSLVTEISEMSNVTNKETPKFRIRGFWDIPSAIVSNSTHPQEVVQFKVEYRYLNRDGKQSNIGTYSLDDKTAAFSSWISIKTEVRNRLYDKETDSYYWESIDVSNADRVKTNQVDIPIQPDEIVELRIKSISEVGYPESPIESDWSNIIRVEFPEELKTQIVDNSTIAKETLKEELQLSVQQDLSTRGVFDHLSSQITIDGKVTKHNSDEVYSGFKDSNGNMINVYEYLLKLTNEISELRSIINRVKGEIEVIVYRNNQEYIAKNGMTLTFNIDCEDYLDASNTNIARSYNNDIYLIKDFMFKVKNKSSASSLGLLSNRRHNSSDVRNSELPQVFWVDNNNELLYSNSDGITRTQLDNQFIWMLNYDDNISNNETVSKLSDDISFIMSSGSNSITNVMSNPSYNIGYKSNSILSFNNDNNSLLDSSKWIDDRQNSTSANKFLTSIHPVTSGLNQLVENNTERVHYITSESSDDINVPINIYFKLNALDNRKTGKNHAFVQFTKNTKPVTHIKKLRVFLETESDSKPFIFDLKFVINRSRTIVKKSGRLINNQVIDTNIVNSHVIKK